MFWLISYQQHSGLLQIHGPQWMIQYAIYIRCGWWIAVDSGELGGVAWASIWSSVPLPRTVFGLELDAECFFWSSVLCRWKLQVRVCGQSRRANFGTLEHSCWHDWCSRIGPGPPFRSEHSCILLLVWIVSQQKLIFSPLDSRLGPYPWNNRNIFVKRGSLSLFCSNLVVGKSVEKCQRRGFLQKFFIWACLSNEKIPNLGCRPNGTCYYAFTSYRNGFMIEPIE